MIWFYLFVSYVLPSKIAGFCLFFWYQKSVTFFNHPNFFSIIFSNFYLRMLSTKNYCLKWFKSAYDTIWYYGVTKVFFMKQLRPPVGGFYICFNNLNACDIYNGYFIPALICYFPALIERNKINLSLTSGQLLFLPFLYETSGLVILK